MGGNLEDLIPIAAMAIPVVAIAGGIVVGVVRTLGQQRLIELAHRERIAAIERGVDPAKLPPLPSIDQYAGAYGHGATAGSARRRAQGLMIGGLVTLAMGIALGIIFKSVEPAERHWVIGVLPAAVGGALLVSALIVWPRNGSAQS